MPPLRTLLLPLTALAGMALVIWAGSLPDYWMLRAMPVGSEAAYPLKPVLIFCAIVLAECSMLLAMLRPRSYCRSWGRALCACLLALGLALFWLQGALHAPPYYGLHLQWWLAVSLGLVLLSVYSAVQAWRQRRNRVSA
ncbi:MAG: hypothetical protein Q7J43_16355 [Pseudomonas sp.]|uniref:hypothetical protein n=1 Tax=Pseudomonas sp. TaxID=306 RepID=UPI0027162127|nr:hypothetical protein [Pseudomonas sp.]MDO9619238.1 hypothetical protein [Pseudomonas sp.]MDP2445208.1 hypothetical protein [Pseudomonas sp.]MDZ4333216.1 hypothetical protein [Pseudomonas sp.]